MKTPSVEGVKQIADGTYVLGSRAHNFYILREGELATVVDAGCSGEWRRFISAVESLGLKLSNVAGVIATHAHADHFGLANQASHRGVDVSVHEDEETRARGTYEGRFAVTASELPIFRIHSLLNFVPLLLAGVTKMEHVDDVGTFADGDVLDLPGNPVALHTPGHTEGHTMFHVPQRGLLFTGDGLITMDMLGPGRGPQMIDRRFNLDHHRALESLDRIVSLEAALLLPGHGQPWAGRPSDAVARARNLDANR